MPMENRVIADLFEEIADMLSADDAPTARFEVRAYQKAAMTIGTLQEPIEDIYRKEGIEGLMKLPGIGKGLAGHIEEYLKTGRMRKYEALKKKYPIDMKQLTSVEGIGAKKAIALYKSLGIRNIDDLKKAIDAHRVSALEGFGERSEELMKKGIALQEASKGRLLLGDALPVAEAIVEKLKESSLVKNAMVAGSARRWRETVGDLDVLALSDRGTEVMELFTSLPEVSSTVVKGPTKTTVWLKIGTQCDLRVIAPESFPAAVQYFTGSKDHNIEVRTIAVRKGYKLNEYGLFDKKNKPVPAKSEEDIYEKLGMQCMPPEMREARGEVKLAQEHKIPKLVELSDIAGDMHMHARGEGVTDTLEEMVSAARGAGLEYIAVTNHTKSLPIEKGMNDAQFMSFLNRVDKLNDTLKGFTVLKGAEVDILKDGKLDLENSTLKAMDCVVASVHSSFKMGEEEMTARIVRALDTGLVHILGHPTGRIINAREAYPLNLEKVFEAAERNSVALEINSFPDRLDLNDTNIMKASAYKVRFAIDSDAHRVSHFADLRYGVGTARRGWLTKSRVLNAGRVGDVVRILKK
jgi:DNA polymerase (family 10)